jgi:secreted PhoX family phosphatase
VFDEAGNLWVVTDISTSSLNRPGSPYEFHKNNAMFMIPTSGRNKGIAFRFANGPVEAEMTGPYFTPDEETLFLNVQHPGELTGSRADSPGVFGQEVTYTSWWPEGNRTTNDNPATPMPSTVAISRGRPWKDDDDSDSDSDSDD